MKKYVDLYNLGIVSEDFTIEVFCELLNKVSANEIEKKQCNSHDVARLLFTEKSVKYYQDLILNTTNK